MERLLAELGNDNAPVEGAAVARTAELRPLPYRVEAALSAAEDTTALREALPAVFLSQVKFLSNCVFCLSKNRSSWHRGAGAWCQK